MNEIEFLSRYIELELSPYDNVEELGYREHVQLHLKKFNTLEKWIKLISDGRLEIPLKIRKFLKNECSVLEIGAGSCWLSSILSKFSEVKEIYALDFSRILLTKIAPFIMDYLKAEAQKIVRVRGSFYNLEALNRKFDVIVADATFHHAQYPLILLNQVAKVLNKNGKFILIREPVAPEFPLMRFMRKSLFGFHERKYGVIEEMYSLSKWKILFQKAGFELRVIPTTRPYFFQMLRLLTLGGSIHFVAQRTSD